MYMPRVLTFSVLAMTLAACQGGSTAEELKSAENTTVEHSSEAVIGPDDAFFAALYLEQIFRSSQAKPQLNSQLALAGERPNAFDFAANFSEQRLQMMAKALLVLGDTDHDLVLSESEFQALQLDLSLFGAGAEVVKHRYSRELFQEVALDPAGLDADALKNLLRGLAPLVKANVDQKSAKEQRLEVVRAWENVINEHDADKDGNLSAAEQKALRKERSEIMARLRG